MKLVRVMLCSVVVALTGCGELAEYLAGKQEGLTFQRTFEREDLCFHKDESDIMSGCSKKAILFLDVRDGKVQEDSNLTLKGNGYSVLGFPSAILPNKKGVAGSLSWVDDECFSGRVVAPTDAANIVLQVVGGANQSALRGELTIDGDFVVKTTFQDEKEDDFPDTSPCTFNWVEQYEASLEDTGVGDTGSAFNSYHGY